MASPPSSLTARGLPSAAVPLSARSLGAVLVFYLAVTLVMTWPLALRLRHGLPGDLGDPVLNVFILGWDLQAGRELLRLQPGAWTRLWNAPFFHPETLTLAYSEHLVGLALQAWPVVALGGSLILAYNLLFLASFVLSALGAFLLARELTGHTAAGLLAGLFFGFAPYRFDQLPHLQVLAAHGMPWALWGLLCWARRGRTASLLWAAAALVSLNLSNGYYLLLFSPCAAAFGTLALAVYGRGRRAWVGAALLALVVTAATLPFVGPYLAVRARGTIVRERAVVASFSPDLFGYLSATSLSRLWGPRLRLYPKDEGALFPGFVPLLLGGLALASALRVARSGAPPAGPRHRAAQALALGSVVLLVLAGPLFVGSPLSIPGLRVASLSRLLTVAGALLVAALALSPRLRATCRLALSTPQLLLAGAALLTVWLSLGPAPTALGRPLALPSLYGWLHAHVPGVDGLRVPGRLGLPFALWLALLAAHGAAELVARVRQGRAIVAALSLAFLAEAWVGPLPLDTPFDAPGLKPLPARLLLGPELPAVYAHVSRLPRGSVLAELPFGADAYELRYMAAALSHGQRLVNGFSGALSPEQRSRRAALRNPLAQPERAWAALTSAGTTHVVVHAGAWGRSRYGERVVRWLESHGARRLAAFQGTVLLELAGPGEPTAGRATPSA